MIRSNPAPEYATQDLPFVPRAITDGIVTLAGPFYCAVLEIGAVNLSLLGPDELAAVAGAYHGILAGLSFPVQVLVRVQPAQSDPYTRWYRARAAPVTAGDSALWELARAHLAHVRDLYATAVPLAHRFYVVVPAPDEPEERQAQGRWPSLSLLRRLGRARHHRAGPNSPDGPLDAEGGIEASGGEGGAGALRVANALASRCGYVADGLRAAGLPVHRLSSRELADLWYACLCPQNAALQPLCPDALLDPHLPVATTTVPPP